MSWLAERRRWGTDSSLDERHPLYFIKVTRGPLEGVPKNYFTTKQRPTSRKEVRYSIIEGRANGVPSPALPSESLFGYRWEQIGHLAVNRVFSSLIKGSIHLSRGSTRRDGDAITVRHVSRQSNEQSNEQSSDNWGAKDNWNEGNGKSDPE